MASSSINSSTDNHQLPAEFFQSKDSVGDIYFDKVVKLDSEIKELIVSAPGQTTLVITPPPLPTEFEEFLQKCDTDHKLRDCISNFYQKINESGISVDQDKQDMIAEQFNSAILYSLAEGFKILSGFTGSEESFRDFIFQQIKETEGCEVAKSIINNLCDILEHLEDKHLNEVKISTISQDTISMIWTEYDVSCTITDTTFLITTTDSSQSYDISNSEDVTDIYFLAQELNRQFIAN